MASIVNSVCKSARFPEFRTLPPSLIAASVFALSAYPVPAQECTPEFDAAFVASISFCDNNRMNDTRLYVEACPKGERAEEARQCLRTFDDRQTLEKLLKECRAHYDAYRMTTPPRSNALECYQRVLDLDPGNDRALDGIKAIEDHYFSQARMSLETEPPSSQTVKNAETMIGQLEVITPENPEIRNLRKQLEELRQRISHAEFENRVRELIEQGKLEEARNLLFENETLDQDVRVDLEREIASAESHRLLEECDAQENPDRFPDALRCLNGLLKSYADTPIAEEAGRRIESLHVPFWNMVQAAATREMYEQYLEFFPGGIFAPLARDRIEQMQ